MKQTAKASKYKFSDVESQRKWLSDVHFTLCNKLAAQRQVIIANGGNPEEIPVEPFDLPRAISRMERRVSHLYRQSSRYEPHQGARECERRRIGGFAGSAGA